MKKGGYWELWALLVVSLAIVITYSCIDPVKVGDTELRSSGYADRLTAPREGSNSGGAAATDSAGGAAAGLATAFPAPLDTASQSILIIGDSMLEGLNPALAAYAKANGHRLNSVIWYSSTTAYWGQCDTLGVYLRQFKPTYIFISLGANELFVSDIRQKREGMLRYFLQQIGDIPYVWIGPPNWKADTGINDMIRDNVPQGRYFRSDGMHFDREKDGAHPTHASARLWMDSIARWMPGHAEHPIRMSPPAPGEKARPDRVVVLQPLK